MRFKTAFLIFSLVFFAPFFLRSSPSFAETTPPDPSSKQLNDIRAKIEEATKKIGELRAQELTLNNQIAYMESQIELTKLRIEQARLEIEEKNKSITQLEGDIGVLGTRIDRMGGLLNRQKEQLGEKVRRGYKESRITFLDVIFGGDDLSEIIRRVKYLSALSVWDQQVFNQMKLTESNFKGQRTILTEKKETVEDLRAEVLSAKTQMEARQEDLGKQKQAKADLLASTLNDEKEFQEHLRRLKEEEAAMRGALKSKLSEILAGLASGSSVAQGGYIGTQGNTGNVSPKPSAACPRCGSHLHFMVLPCEMPLKCEGDACYLDATCYSDPQPYLDNPNYVHPMEFGGDWRKYVTQWFGVTDFARSGAGGYDFHSGIDFDVEDEAPIVAIQNGVVYYGVDLYGGKYALMKHDNGVWSAYWHLQ